MSRENELLAEVAELRRENAQLREMHSKAFDQWRIWQEAATAARKELAELKASASLPAHLNNIVDKSPTDQPNAVGPLTLDTDRQVFFYEQDFYVLSNFSSFALDLGGHMYPTSEHAYHAHKFPGDSLKQAAIRCAKSAHDAFKLAERWKQYRMGAWEQVRVDIMRGILRAKAAQHEYVRRKLLATGDRELIENSWRDDFWGWGPNRDGQNMLGQLWMEIRAEQRAADNSSAAAPAKVCPNCDAAIPVKAWPALKSSLPRGRPGAAHNSKIQ